VDDKGRPRGDGPDEREADGDKSTHGEAEPEGGPLARQRFFLEERLAHLGPVEEARPEAEEAEERELLDTLATTSPPSEPEPPESPAAPGPPVEEDRPVPGPPVEEDRRDLIRQYRERQRDKLETEGREPDHIEPSEDPESGPDEASPEEGDPGDNPSATVFESEPPQPPAPPPANNWISIGPSVLRQGQGGVKPPTSGRAVGIAVAPAGTRVYVATANGGVWRSNDTGVTWRSLMEAWDLNPTTAASDSLACGAIAIVPGPPDVIFVGSGEGDGGAYNGVGPIVSFDDGTNWATEQVAVGSPALAGSAFYSLAVDPANADRVVAGSRQGVYRREPNGASGFHWARKTMGTATWVPSVVVARQGTTTTFYAARWFGPVYTSTDGDTWTVVGAGFPTTNVGRVGLAVQPGNPNVIYALVARSDNSQLLGLYRLDLADGTWRQVTGVPGQLFGPNPTAGQGWYDLVVAVDPNDVNRVYVGGATVSSGGDWSGAFYRGDLTVVGTAVSMTPTFIGNSVHADIHALAFAPGDSNKLWVGCDGGVFYSTNPTGSGDIFAQRNTGLATLTLEHLGQHPTEDAVLFCGSQDNGGQRFSGEEAWLYSSGGDAGFQLVNWNDPYRVLSTYVYGTIRRSTNGGVRYSYLDVSVPLAMSEQVLFYAPMAGTPRNPGTPAEANVVAFGSIRPWISTAFGGGWTSIPNGTLAGDSLNERIRALAFASATRLYAGTMSGGVYQFDQAGATWTRTQINTIGGANALSLAGPVTDIAVDLADATGSSIYLTFGGVGDYRHVWHFDGIQWQQRSGPAVGNAASLLDVQANAIVVDPANPTNIYVGADIGVWTSTNGGSGWAPFSEGLPDAGVLDLALHGPRRLLRAATHGRSVYERTLDAVPKPGIELYVRDTQLDQGRFATTNGLPDPTQQGQTVVHYRGPDIKLDTPDVGGHYQFPLTGTIDFLQFVDTLTDDFQNVATHATATITTRVYVQVHNRGVVAADNVQVMLLLANASAGLPSLPAGYAANVQSGTPITTPDWRTVGFATLNDVRPGAPKVAAFDLTSNLLPPPANLSGNQHHCVLALLHHPSDPFTATQTVTDWLSVGERKAAHKNLTVVQFTGTPPTPPPVVLPIRIHNARLDERLLTKLSLQLREFPGRVRLYLPHLETDGDIRKLIRGGRPTEDDGSFANWARGHIRMVEESLAGDHAFDPEWSKQRIGDIEMTMEARSVIEAEGKDVLSLDRIIMEPESYRTIFLMFDRPADGRVGQHFEVDVQQLDAEKADELIGGITTRVELVPEPKEERRKIRAELTLNEIELTKRVASESQTKLSHVIRCLIDLMEDDPDVDKEIRRRLSVDPRGSPDQS
jgi:hypothetical protein